MRRATSFPSLFLIVLYTIKSALATTLETPPEVEGNIASSFDLYSQTWYILIYAFLWNVVFEISLIIMIHFKQNSSYVREHIVLNLMTCFGQLANNIALCLYTGSDWQSPFIRRELLLLIGAVVQLLFGFILNQKLESEELVKGIFVMRFLHKYWGRFIYLATKVQMIMYAMNYFGEKRMQFVVTVIFIAGIIILTHATLWILYFESDVSMNDITDFLIHTSPKANEYNELLKSIDGGEFEQDLYNKSRSSSLSNRSKKEELTTTLAEQKKPIDWVIIEDKVFDITDLRHPKGNYILNAVKSKDITRELYGLKGWRFSAYGFSKNSQHRHSTRTLKYLKKRCIGQLTPSEAICLSFDPTNPSISRTESNLDLFNSNLTIEIESRSNRISDWKITQTYTINEQSRIVLLSKLDKDYVVDLSAYWLSNFGKYFLVRSDTGKRDYFYTVLSLSPRYLSLRKEWYQKLNVPFIQSMQTYSSFYLKELAELNPILKTASVFTRNFNKSQDNVRDPFIPLFVHSPKKTPSVIDSGSRFEVGGPYGLGLGFDSNSTKKIMIIIKDSGVLPFTDFFEYLSQRSLLELSGLKQPHPIFGKEYLLNYTNEMMIWIYWEISEEFYETARVLGLESLETFNAACRESANMFKSDPTKISNVVHRISIVTNKPSRENQKLSVTNVLGKSYASIKEIAVVSEKYTIDQVIVSGEPVFADRVLKGSNLTDQQITIL